MSENFRGDFLTHTVEKVAVFSTKTVISVKQGKIERKLLLNAYKKSRGIVLCQNIMTITDAGNTCNVLALRSDHK